MVVVNHARVGTNPNAPPPGEADAPQLFSPPAAHAEGDDDTRLFSPPSSPGRFSNGALPSSDGGGALDGGAAGGGDGAAVGGELFSPPTSPNPSPENTSAERERNPLRASLARHGSARSLPPPASPKDAVDAGVSDEVQGARRSHTWKRGAGATPWCARGGGGGRADTTTPTTWPRRSI